MAGKKKSTTKASKAAKPPKATKTTRTKGDPKPGEKELKAAMKRLQAQLDKAESKVEEWKGKAKEQGARAKKLEKRLSESAKSGRPAARRVVEKIKDTTAETIAVTATAIDPSDSTRPDETWTVTRLRAEARTRGVVSYSRKTKAQLLDDLRRRPDGLGHR